MKNFPIVYNLFFIPVFCLSQDWNSIGPPTQPTSLCISASCNYMLIGTPQTGVARSVDSGQTWNYAQGLPLPQPIGSGYLPSYVVMSLQHDPLNHQIVYAGIGPDETATGHGVYKSTNGGMTWEAKNIGLPQWRAVRNISINPFDPKEIFIYVRQSSSGSGIYRTTNSGDDWSPFFMDSYSNSGLLFNELDSTVRYTISVDGTVHRWKNGIYTAIKSSVNFFSTGFPVATFLNSKTGSLFYVHGSNIYRWGTDSSWLSLLSNINATGHTVKTINNASINTVAGTIFISTNIGIFKSNDDGIHWSFLNTMQDMIFACDSAQVIGTGLSGTYFSADGGINWLWTSEGPKINNVYSFSYVPSIDSGVFYTISSSVLLKSTNSGKIWTQLQIPNNAVPSVVHANPLNANIVYVGCGSFYTSNLGMYKSYDGGIHWQQILPSKTIAVTAMDIDLNDTSRIIAGTPGELFQSTNSGATWKSILSIGNDTHSETKVVKISKSNPAKIYTSVSSNRIERAGLIVTADSGNTWNFMQSGSVVGFTAIAIDPTNDSIVYFGGSSVVYKSTNSGESWIVSGGVAGFINDIKIAPDDPNYIIASGRGEQIGQGGLIHTTDGGESWSAVSFEGLSDNARTFAHIEPRDNSYEVYVGTLSYGLLKKNFSRITSVVRNNVWHPNNTYLDQNYPNPFNPVTIISYALPKDGMVTLTIYDALGREVKTLVNEFKTTGRYTAAFDATNLSSGIYLYKIVADKYSAVKKMLILK